MDSKREFICSVGCRYKEDKKFYYLYPQFEILEDGRLRYIENKKEEFPDSGNVFALYYPNGIENYLNRLVIGKLSLHENPNSEGTSKYLTKDYREIVFPKESEIIEIISVNDRNIEDMINFSELREIQIENVPLNNRIMIEIGDYIYGCFEFSLGQKNTNTDQVLVTLHTNKNTNGSPEYNIKKYKKSDLDKVIFEAITAGNEDNMYNYRPYFQTRRFIYNQEVLQKIEFVEILDFIEDNVLINLIHKTLKETNDYNKTNKEIKELKDMLGKLTHFELEFRDIRLKRLEHIVDLTSEYSKFGEKFIDIIFNTERGKIAKIEYLNSHPHMLNELIKKSENYDTEKAKIEDEKIRLTQEKMAIEDEIIKYKAEVEKLKKEKEALEQKAYEKKLLEHREEIQLKEKHISNLKEEIAILEQKKSTINNELKNKLNALRLVESIEKLKEEEDDLRKNYYRVKGDLDDITNRYNKMKDEIIDKAYEMQKTKFSDMIVDIITNKPKDNTEMFKFDNLKARLMSDISFEELISKLEELFDNANRNIKTSDIINYLICITQKFITVFAGEPGVGKTSTCKLLAKGLGLYSERFNNITVERGWTSRKDLIGYYNPLNNVIEEAPTQLLQALKQVDYENRNGVNNIPYFVLLDEANLSPIEHYWSNFLTLSDDFINDPIKCNQIQVGGDTNLYLNEGFRFLATINFDHTTEPLSHRFLDRAWIILMEPSNIDNFIEYEEAYIENDEKIIDFYKLREFFSPKDNAELERHLKDALKALLAEFKRLGITSPRSIIAIKNYCLVAQDLMKEGDQFKPLDYAISQKLLPLINGYGEDYGSILQDIREMAQKYSLDKCNKILSKIIEVGKKEHHYYHFFNI